MYSNHSYTDTVDFSEEIMCVRVGNDVGVGATCVFRET